MIKGQKASIEALKNMRYAAQHRHYTPEIKKQMSKSHLRNINSLGFKHSLEENEQNRLRNLGEKNGMFGKKHSKKTKDKISRANTGIPRFFSEEHNKNVSLSKMGSKNPMYGKCKEKSPVWKGGISFEPYSIDWKDALKRSIRERDNYTCQIKTCKKIQKNNNFPVHHIDYNKKNCNPNNLITLCPEHHGKTNSNRDSWIEYFKNLTKK